MLNYKEFCVFEVKRVRMVGTSNACHVAVVSQLRDVFAQLIESALLYCFRAPPFSAATKPYL